MNQTKNSKIGFVFGTACLGLLAGCVGYVGSPRHAAVYTEEQPSSVYVELGVATQDDYVYYPSYQVYYSSYRRQYVYLDGRSWVSRPAPPHVSEAVFFASPSVRVAFHDAPENHHAEIARQYPKHWTSPQSNHGSHEERRADDKARN